MSHSEGRAEAGGAGGPYEPPFSQESAASPSSPSSPPRLLLGQAPVVLQDLEELPLRKLGHDAELRAGLKGVQHLDDVLVPGAEGERGEERSDGGG